MRLPKSAVPVIAALSAAGLTACGPPTHHGAASRTSAVLDGPVTPVGDQMALAYMKAHPVPALPHMTPGILVGSTDYSDNTFTWFAFSLNVLTPQGQTIVVRCGDPAVKRSCPLQKGEVDLPDSLPNGMYLYVRSDGSGNAPGDYRLITVSTARLPQVCSDWYRKQYGSYDPRERCAAPKIPAGGA